MKISLYSISKRFNYDWIFRNINLECSEEKKYAVTGPNGSGKSTFLKIISGSLSPSSGTIAYTEEQKTILSENIYIHVSYAAPYMELIDSFTMNEMIRFHMKMKTFLPGINEEHFKEILALPDQKKKQIRLFSSGMKQKLKLALAVLSDTKILLLDEPTTNFDSKATDWYLQMMETYAAGRIVFIGSNTEREYPFCDQTIDILQYKQP